MAALKFSLIPMLAIMIGALIAGWRTPGEKLVAYYDVTLNMKGTEAAILTDRRVIYHKDGRTTAIQLADIKEVRPSKGAMGVLILEIESGSGELMKIEIAALNNGEIFKSALLRGWEKARTAPSP